MGEEQIQQAVQAAVYIYNLTGLVNLEILTDSFWKVIQQPLKNMNTKVLSYSLLNFHSVN